jgi:hypothetical protein
MSGISPKQKKDPRKKGGARIEKKKKEVKPQWKSSMFQEKKRKRG